MKPFPLMSSSMVEMKLFKGRSVPDREGAARRVIDHDGVPLLTMLRGGLVIEFARRSAIWVVDVDRDRRPILQVANAGSSEPQCSDLLPS
jgi:hypothetical protein